jgi:hypothetical protein
MYFILRVRVRQQLGLHDFDASFQGLDRVLNIVNCLNKLIATMAQNNPETLLALLNVISWFMGLNLSSPK